MWSWIRSSIGRCFMFRHRHVGSMFLHEVPPFFWKPWISRIACMPVCGCILGGVGENIVCCWGWILLCEHSIDWHLFPNPNPYRGFSWEQWRDVCRWTHNVSAIFWHDSKCKSIDFLVNWGGDPQQNKPREWDMRQNIHIYYIYSMVILTLLSWNESSWLWTCRILYCRYHATPWHCFLVRITLHHVAITADCCSKEQTCSSWPISRLKLSDENAELSYMTSSSLQSTFMLLTNTFFQLLGFAAQPFSPTLF